MPTVAKGIVKLVGSRDLTSLRSALAYLEPCAGSLEVLSDACMGPAVMAISLIPKIGNIIGFVCTQSSNIVAKFRSAQQRVDSGLAVVASDSDIVAAVEAPAVLTAAAAAARRALLSSSSSLIRASSVTVYHSLAPVDVSVSFQPAVSRQLLGNRKEEKQEKKEDRKEEKQEKKEEKQEMKEEKKEERQEKIEDRKEERQEKIEDRKEEREEKKEERQERKEEKKEKKKNRKKTPFNPLNIFLKKVRISPRCSASDFDGSAGWSSYYGCPQIERHVRETCRSGKFRYECNRISLLRRC